MAVRGPRLDPHTQHGSGPGCDGRVETAFSASHLFGSASRSNADYQPYLVYRLYFGGVDAPLQGESSGNLAEYEVGMTFGNRVPVKVWKVPIPRVGFGYVFGHDLSVVRVVFGLPSRSLKSRGPPGTSGPTSCPAAIRR